MRIVYERDQTTARLEGRIPAQVVKSVDVALTFFEPQFRYDWRYKTGRWDGRTHLLHDNMEFPAGVGHRVIAVLDTLGLPYEIDDRRDNVTWAMTANATTLHDNTKGSIELFDDQKLALATFLSNPRGCLELAPNAGKTEIAAALLKMSRPFKALFIVDRKGLMAQTAARFEERLQERVGMLGGGYKDDTRRISVATIQTLHHHIARYKKTLFPKISTLVVDECHCVTGRTWSRVLSEIPAPVRLGLSGTIKEASRRLVVESFLGPILHEISPKELIASGRSAEPAIYMLRVGGRVDDAAGPDVAYVQGIVRNRRRNELAVEAARRSMLDGDPVLMLCVRIEHGLVLQTMLDEAGIYAPFLHGQTSLDEITTAKRKMEKGTLPVVCASTIFDLGQDMPNIRTLIICSGMRSPLRTTQRTSRGARKKLTGTNKYRVLDFFDHAHSILRNQSDERRKTYKRKFGNVQIIDSLDVAFPVARQPRVPVLA